MLFRRVIAPATALLVALAGLAAAEEKTVSGQVIDAGGKPVAGAEIAADWSWSSTDKKFTTKKAIKTDPSGRFVGKLDVSGDPVVVMAFSKDRTVGGVLVLPAANVSKTIKLNVAPLSSVTAELEAVDFPDAPKAIDVKFLYGDGKLPLITIQHAVDEKLSLKLPAGDYQLVAECTGARDPETLEFTLAVGQAAEDLGKVKLEPDVKGRAATATGRAVPELTFTDARGVPKNFKLSDLKGKWVMIEFWGYW